VCIELYFYPYLEKQSRAEDTIAFLIGHGFRFDSLWGPKRPDGKIKYADGVFVR
jgi:hypothetical protein